MSSVYSGVSSAIFHALDTNRASHGNHWCSGRATGRKSTSNKLSYDAAETELLFRGSSRRAVICSGWRESPAIFSLWLVLLWHPLQENGQKEGSVIQNDLSESLEEEVRAFLSDEEKLHLIDDLTKVNPVTTTTGKQPARGVSPGESLSPVATHTW